MLCILCRSLKWLLTRYDPGWIEAADEFRFKALNTNTLFDDDADSARLRRNYGLWQWGSGDKAVPALAATLWVACA
jgi:hypothetical protein